MSPVYYASGVVMAACIAFLVVGTVYRWDLTSPGYGRWTQVIGALALGGIAFAAAWNRLSEPMVVFAVVVVGGTLAAGFVWAHRLLSRRLLEMAEGGGANKQGEESVRPDDARGRP